MPESARPALTGIDLLRHPQSKPGQRRFTLPNGARSASKGCCRRSPDTLETQIARVHSNLSLLDSDLQNYLFLTTCRPATRRCSTPC